MFIVSAMMIENKNEQKDDGKDSNHSANCTPYHTHCFTWMGFASNNTIGGWRW
jgi:hypothetical protein